MRLDERKYYIASRTHGSRALAINTKNNSKKCHGEKIKPKFRKNAFLSGSSTARHV
jgi:hypothetical protein